MSEEANQLVGLVGSANASILREKGEVSRFINADPKLTLFPEASGKARLAADIVAMKPTIGVEMLRFAKSDDGGCTSPACILRIYNVLRSLSSLKGIEYYSVSRKRMRIFYEDAYIVDSAEEKKRQPDPADASVPDQSRLLCFFRDSSFGEYVCSIDYGKEGNTISMRMQNLTKIWYLFVPIIDPDNMLSYMLIIPADEGILFYGVSAIKGDDALGIAVSKADSLYNRLVALYNWFLESLNQVSGKPKSGK
jgi:hypothetical protein